MTPPLVTIAIPTRNREALLRRSLASALGQSIADIEVVVSDDASTDGTGEMLASVTDPRVVVLRQPACLGISGNMNAALAASRGQYLLVLSDDDYLEPHCLEALLGPFGEEIPNLTFSYGQWYFSNGSSVLLQRSDAPPVESGYHYLMGYWSGIRPTILHGLLCRRHDVIAEGGFIDGFAQDTALAIRLAARGAVAHVARPVAWYCLQPTSTTHTIDENRLIDDRRSLLTLTLTLGREAGWSRSQSNAIASTARRRLSKAATAALLTRAAHGQSKMSLLTQAWTAREDLRANPVLSMTALFLGLLLPSSLLSTVRDHVQRRRNR